MELKWRETYTGESADKQQAYRVRQVKDRFEAQGPEGIMGEFAHAVEAKQACEQHADRYRPPPVEPSPRRAAKDDVPDKTRTEPDKTHHRTAAETAKTAKTHPHTATSPKGRHK